MCVCDVCSKEVEVEEEYTVYIYVQYIWKRIRDLVQTTKYHDISLILFCGSCSLLWMSGVWRNWSNGLVQLPHDSSSLLFSFFLSLRFYTVFFFVRFLLLACPYISLPPFLVVHSSCFPAPPPILLAFTNFFFKIGKKREELFPIAVRPVVAVVI